MKRAIGMLAGGLALLAVLSGCGAFSRPAETRVTLTVAVYQLRSDYAVRQAQIEVTNHSSVDVQVTSASFTSSWFASTVSSPSAPNQLLAKSTTDFKVVLAAARCDVARATPSVTIRFTRPDKSTGTVTTTPTIPFDSIALVHAQDCAQHEFEKVATISIAPAVRFEQVAGKPIALLDVTFTPTGAAGSVTLHSTEDTTLLAQREGTLRTIGLTLTAASGPTTVTLDYVPAGCLQHRVAEDKIGTLIPMRVDAGPYRNTLFSMPVPAAVKAQLLDWVGVYCGW